MLYLVDLDVLNCILGEAALVVLRLTFGSLLRNPSWQDSGDHVHCQESNSCHCMQVKHFTHYAVSPFGWFDKWGFPLELLDYHKAFSPQPRPLLLWSGNWETCMNFTSASIQCTPSNEVQWCWKVRWKVQVRVMHGGCGWPSKPLSSFVYWIPWSPRQNNKLRQAGDTFWAKAQKLPLQLC